MKNLLDRHFDVISGVLCLIIMTTFALSAATLTFGSLRTPDSGLWPLSISLCGVLLSVVLIVFGRDVPSPDKLSSPSQITLYLAVLVLFPPLFYLLGFIPASILALFVLMWWAARYSLLASLLISVPSSIAIYAVFAYGLGLQIDGF